MSVQPVDGRLREVRPGVQVLLAPNPGPMTLTGTNTWLLGAEDGLLVVDPGPDLDRHLQRIADAGRIARIVLTHRHPDHSEGAAHLHELTGAPVDAADPAHVHGGGAVLVEGDVVTVGAFSVQVLATPGHTSDSISLRTDGAVLTGDTILGSGTTVVAHPDGVLADYLDSLRRLADLGDLAVWPGHGPELASVGAAATAYLAHRALRLEQVRAVLVARGGEVTAREVVETVYADVDRAVWAAAEWSVRAQLEYLRATENQARTEDPG